jgi:hypothetical protein
LGFALEAIALVLFTAYGNMPHRTFAGLHFKGGLEINHSALEYAKNRPQTIVGLLRIRPGGGRCLERRERTPRPIEIEPR